MVDNAIDEKNPQGLVAQRRADMQWEITMTEKAMITPVAKAEGDGRKLYTVLSGM